jgi:type III secretion protein L
MKYFSLIYRGDVHPDSEDKVLSKEDYSTLITAEEIVRLAREDAQKHKAEVEAECLELKEIAKKEGYDEGLHQFNEHLLNFDRKLRALKLELQQQILPLALKAAKKIVGNALEVNPETIVEIVMQTLTPITQNQRYTIYVNRADKDVLEANKPKIKQILEHVQTLTIQERADVAPGGCIIETESGIINASIENQWRALEAAFGKFMKS